jgi:uncharacterized repeat protein (TIGR02543 family)
LELHFLVPNLSAGEFYTVTPDGGSASYVTGLFYDDVANGFYERIVAEAAGDFVFGDNGKVHSAFDSPVRSSVSSTVNSTGNKLYNTTVSGDDTRIAIEPDSNGDMTVESDSAPVQISVSGDYNVVTFADVDTGAGGVTVHEENKTDVQLLGAGSQVLESQTIGYKISFRSMGGDPVEAITNIAPGSRVSAPANPTRGGYVFAGWYLDENYTTQWSFDTPVQSDLVLFAKWDTVGSDSDDTGGNQQGGGGSSGGGSPSVPAAPAAQTETGAEDRSGNPFTDVKEGDWFYEDVVYAYTHALMNGTSDTAFSPGTPMTRGMLVTVLGRLHGADASAAAAESAFSDVKAGQYYAPYVAWAKENGLVNGVSAGKFAPDAEITRQDLATLITRYADFAGKQFPVTLQYTAFADEDKIADYARSAVKTLYGGGIVSGKQNNIFDPKGKATRAEVAAVLHRFIEKTQ